MSVPVFVPSSASSVGQGPCLLCPGPGVSLSLVASGHPLHLHPVEDQMNHRKVRRDGLSGRGGQPEAHGAHSLGPGCDGLGGTGWVPEIDQGHNSG